ncbi:MAG: polysaccharide export protein [Syntrophobacterales bacterium]|nr:polysaccharide export protein [Syntrophobacterales bacterium]
MVRKMEEKARLNRHGNFPLLSAFVCLLAGLVAGCGAVGVVAGIPVRDYRPPAAERERIAALAKGQASDILRLTQIEENSAFTEKNGVPEYTIGPGDVLTLTYWMPFSSYSPSTGQQAIGSAEGFMQTKFDVTVRPDGKISYSFGDDIPAAGHTASEVRTILLAGIKDYIRNPRLDVLVKEYNSKNALIFGRINNLQGTGMSGPGKYPLKGKMTVLDMINMAGGPITGVPQRGALTSASNYGGNGDLRKVELVRKGKRYTLNLYKALFGGDMSNNVIVDNGDMITVPEEPTFARRVYVFGQVSSPGVFSLTDANDLLTAMSLTGGTTPVAVRSDVKIVRGYEETQGKPLVLAANLDDILKRGDLSQNLKLQDGDLVYVPRMLIGDINEFIANINPLMLFLTTGSPPSAYRDAWKKDSDWMRY